MSPILPVAVLGATLVLLPSTALFADDIDACMQSTSDFDTGISSCTRLIESGLSGADLAVAYKRRGDNFRFKREYDRAINDFDQATRLTPDYANAYYARDGCT